ncbi:right-handed parallel beta-helix repeat-containing protein [Methylobacterium sp. sgz302541]|uniref:right-handed parallel beta-helix repeat-containing protein n=1 Tax=unclassified Methylobacterium TaxID=2615210 RepID=UPI003D32C589
MRHATAATLAGCLLTAIPAAHAAPPCDDAARKKILAPAVPGDESVRLACSLRLSEGEHVTKRILLEGASASGVAIDCNGARIGRSSPPPAFGQFAIEIRSGGPRPGRDGEPVWERPSDIAIRGCAIDGHIRIWGMGLNGQGEAVKASSHRPGHTERAQAAAPTRIAITDSTLTALGGIPLYLGPGVTQVTLQGSRLRGRSSSVAVYLDAESARNVIDGNDIDVETGRETVAVDGSAGNRITGNRFVLHGQRGIDLYRNCGEGGTVRHQTPSDNLIAENRYRHAGFWRPDFVKVGSREGWRLYCGEDAGYPFGSSLDDGDHATGNVLRGNSQE